MSYATRTGKPPRTLSEAEQQKLLRVTGRHSEHYRDHVIFSFALGTGLREHEIAALELGDVAQDLDAGGLRVKRRVELRVFKHRRKPGRKGLTAPPKPQAVILPDNLLYKLRKYLDRWRAPPGYLEAGGDLASAPLFPSRNGGHISTRRLREMFAAWQVVAGFERRFSFHALRHTFATNVYRSKRDIVAVKELARHGNIQTSVIYTHLSEEELEGVAKDLPS